MKKLLLVLAVATSLVVVPSVDATVRKVKDEKAVEVLYTCDKAADVTIHAGSTNRNWRVNGVEQWLSFYDTKTWEDVELPVVVEWWHENSQAWKPADESYTSESKEQDCPEPTVTPIEPTATPIQPTSTPTAEISHVVDILPTTEISPEDKDSIAQDITTVPEELPRTGIGSFLGVYLATTVIGLGTLIRLTIR